MTGNEIKIKIFGSHQLYHSLTGWNSEIC